MIERLDGRSPFYSSEPEPLVQLPLNSAISAVLFPCASFVRTDVLEELASSVCVRFRND